MKYVKHRIKGIRLITRSEQHGSAHSKNNTVLVHLCMTTSTANGDTCDYAGPRLRLILCSSIFFLMWAMALPGFRPLGHVLVQFMMVMQRYSCTRRMGAVNRRAWVRVGGGVCVVGVVVVRG